MQAITQTADDGMYVITRGCSQMSRVPQKINNIVEIFFHMDVDCGRQTSGGKGVGSMRTPADKGGRGQKLAKSCGHLLCMTPKQNLLSLTHATHK